MSGGFSFSAVYAALIARATLQQRWIIRGHKSASIRTCTTRLFLTRKAPHCDHCWVTITPYIGPPSTHYQTIIDPGSYMRQYRAVIRPTKNPITTSHLLWHLTGLALAPNWSPLAAYWSLVDHYLVTIAPATTCCRRPGTQLCCITAPVAALHLRSHQPGLRGLQDQQVQHNYASRRLFRLYRPMVTAWLTTASQHTLQHCFRAVTALFRHTYTRHKTNGFSAST